MATCGLRHVATGIALSLLASTGFGVPRTASATTVLETPLTPAESSDPIGLDDAAHAALGSAITLSIFGWGRQAVFGAPVQDTPGGGAASADQLQWLATPLVFPESILEAIPQAAVEVEIAVANADD